MGIPPAPVAAASTLYAHNTLYLSAGIVPPVDARRSGGGAPGERPARQFAAVRRSVRTHDLTPSDSGLREFVWPLLGDHVLVDRLDQCCVCAWLLSPCLRIISVTSPWLSVWSVQCSWSMVCSMVMPTPSLWWEPATRGSPSPLIPPSRRRIVASFWLILRWVFEKFPKESMPGF